MADNPPRGFLARIFLSPEEKRPRAGWRILGQTLLLVVFTILFGIPVGILNAVRPGSSTFFWEQVASGLAIVVSVFAARRWLDRRSIASLGLARGAVLWKDLFAGIAIAGVMMSFIFLLLWAADWLRLRGLIWQVRPLNEVLAEMALFGLLFIAVGFYEELLSRGYHLQNLEEGLNTGWAVFISSAVFGLAHLFNPNATWLSALGIFGAGVFFAYSYLRTRQLWLPIGLHVGWNFFEGPVFGFPVSGLNAGGLFLGHTNGSELITGGAFGPEAGLILLPGLLLGAWLIYLYSRGRLEDQD